VFDCFLFSDELLLLEFRLRLLDELVYRFVLVEADRTFQGDEKPLVFQENRRRFAEWESKIIHVIVHDLPDTNERWAREQHQRRAIMRGLSQAAPEDLALISDADEIPKPSAIRQILRDPPDTHVALDMKWLTFFVDLQSRRSWTRAKACRVGALHDPELLRNAGAPERVLQEAGWHLSWLSHGTGAARKVESYSHTEYNREQLKSDRHFARCRRLGVSPVGDHVLWPVTWDQIPLPLRELVRTNPGLLHGERGWFDTILARCYLLNIWGTKFLPLSLTDRHPVLTFLIAGLLRVCSYPPALARRRWRERR
jgi:hypothetical protein